MSKPEEKNTAALSTAASVKKELTPGERFVGMVLKNFAAGSAGEIKLSPFHQKLIQNYFIKLDMVLKTAEAKRLAKSEQYRESLAYTWDNVNREKLAIDVVIFATLGIDPMQPNQINLICYNNTAMKKYDVNFMLGYRGIELKAKKYGLDVPDDVIIEVVYAKDKFRPIKKSHENRVESYEFEIGEKGENPFDRGEVVGGFYYHNFISTPEKNKLRLFSMADIEKRRPKNASVEFWGGEKPEYKDGKKTGKKEQVDGWFDEMVYKTLCRAAYNSITIDGQKIDDNYVKMVNLEEEGKKSTEEKVETQVQKHNGTEEVDFEEVPEVKVEPAAAGQAAAAAQPKAEEKKPEAEKKKDNSNGGGPDF